MTGTVLSRRVFLGGLCAASAGCEGAAAQEGARKVGYGGIAQQIRERARLLSLEPYVPKPVVAGDLTYDQYRSIRFNPSRALWANRDDLAFQADFFHVGGLFKHEVALFEVAEGAARPIRYVPDMFDFGAEAEAIRAVADPAFAGLRLHHPMNGLNVSEFAVFLGASYFRAIGLGERYGLSARGLAIRSGLPGEEFPYFESFWLEQPAPGDSAVTLHALLDSESVAGAYRFVMAPGESTVMDISVSLFARRKIENIGLAPITSMFMRGEADRGSVSDFRPQIHDSEALSIRTGANDWLLRPLRNPKAIEISAYADDNIQGFGLIQRDRDFNHYLDLEARYDLRPGLWVEPVGGWGAGEVRLVELPSPDETQDNIVAFWTPNAPLVPGEEFFFQYRLHWGPHPPVNPVLARVVGTYTGVGGIASSPDPALRKFVIDFSGGPLKDLAPDVELRVDASATNAEIVASTVLRNVPLEGWRVFLDVRAEYGSSPEVRCVLKLNDQAISEFWTIRWDPTEPDSTLPL
ncbi:glucan biosynthesis protein [Aurantimonas endophytica]|uniref:glucan biosynthesis protein n=1 Tax=Aurantimonas endophytica TaxID=1522175 RepID=UPI0031B5F4BA